MLYIITEDSESGLSFWRAVKRIVLNNSNNVKVLSSYGVSNLANTVLESGVIANDTLLLCIDNTGLDTVMATALEFIYTL